MQTAATLLAIIRERGKRGLPLEDVYRHLYNPDLYLNAYSKLAQNEGAMTRGTTAETVDDMSLEKIKSIIEAVRYERWRWTPVRRVYIPKSNGNLRPLGMPTWSDKLLQQVIRSILETYYEPQFSDRSHGFRPGRGCHTALGEVKEKWSGTKWFIEGDISKCFDNLDHEVLMSIIGEHIRDNRFLRLIKHMLQAGYLEEWTYHNTYSGTPQGGVVSPLLANIYLNKLDQWVEYTLIPKYIRGEVRAMNPQYNAIHKRIMRARKRGDRTGARRMERQRRTIPSGDPHDPEFRRLKYIRYADDFLLGFIGPREEALVIKERIREYLRDVLKLELSEEKTLITNAHAERAKFLGYEIATGRADDRLTKNRRATNGIIQLYMPRNVITEASKQYTKEGRPVRKPELIHDSDHDIVAKYQAVYRGIAQYYLLAVNVSKLNRLEYIMEQSLVHTLANKFKMSTKAVYAKYTDEVDTGIDTRRCIKVVVPRAEKEPLITHFGGIPLQRRTMAYLVDDKSIEHLFNARTQLIKRLLAQVCELCGGRENIKVHHIHRLKDLKKPGRKERPAWMVHMSAMRRKTLVVCHACHTAIHAGTVGVPKN